MLKLIVIRRALRAHPDVMTKYLAGQSRWVRNWKAKLTPRMKRQRRCTLTPIFIGR